MYHIHTYKLDINVSFIYLQLKRLKSWTIKLKLAHVIGELMELID